MIRGGGEGHELNANPQLSVWKISLSINNNDKNNTKS